LGGRHGLRWASALVAAAAAAVTMSACGQGHPAASDAAAVTKLFDAGLRAQAAGHEATADADYLAVLKQDPGNHLAWYDLGVIAQHAGDDSSAESDYRHAIAADRSYVPALFNLGTVLAEVTARQAAAEYTKVLAIEPDDASARLNLGYALLAEGKPTQGHAQIAAAERLDPSLGTTTTTAPTG
jgi:Tfp pilus assembly protein PilF